MLLGGIPQRRSARLTYNKNMALIRTLLADDHAVVRAGIRNALLSIPDIEVVGEAADGQDLIQALKQLRPDLLVVDVAMPNFEPINTVQKIKMDYPSIKILVVSAYDDEIYVVGLLEAGVDGYHLKDRPLADLQLAIQRILSGERWISGSLINRLVHRRAPPATPAIPNLTHRQRNLLRLLSQGCDNRKIAHILEISVKTVENHLTNLYRTIGVESRLEALKFAMDHPEVLATSGSETIEPSANTQDTLTVLLVDDNARYRQQLGRLIGKTNSSVTLYEAEDTLEAVRLAQKVKPHLAFVDVVLTDEDGIQCMRRIKGVSTSTRVILISAYPDHEFRRMGLGAGAVAFLDKKDIDSAAMKQVLSNVLS